MTALDGVLAILKGQACGIDIALEAMVVDGAEKRILTVTGEGSSGERR